GKRVRTGARPRSGRLAATPPGLALPGVPAGGTWQQGLHDPGLVRRDRGMEGRDLHGIPRDLLHVRAALEQPERDFGASEERGEAERPEAVLRVAVEQRRILVEQLAQTLELSGRCGLEGVQRGVVPEQ